MILITIWCVMVTYGYIPHFFRLLKMDGPVEIKTIALQQEQSFWYPADSKREQYNTTLITLESSTVTQGCACSSSLYENSYRIRSPKLFSFYEDLGDESKVKFPTAVCSGYRSLQAGDKVYYKIYGDKDKAVQNANCPPQTNDYVLVTSKVNINFTHGFYFMITFIPLVILSIILVVFLMMITSDQYIHYWAFGPFAIVLLLIDILLWLCRCCCQGDPEEDEGP